ELRSARGAQWARAATNAQERSARSGKQGPRQCLEVWSCFAPQENGQKFSGRLHGWQNTENSAAASCKDVRSTEKEYHSHVVNSLLTGSLCRRAHETTGLERSWLADSMALIRRRD